MTSLILLREAEYDTGMLSKILLPDFCYACQNNKKPRLQRQGHKNVSEILFLLYGSSLLGRRALRGFRFCIQFIYEVRTVGCTPWYKSCRKQAK
jgi:hypothetical protein